MGDHHEVTAGSEPPGLKGFLFAIIAFFVAGVAASFLGNALFMVYLILQAGGLQEAAVDPLRQSPLVIGLTNALFWGVGIASAGVAWNRARKPPVNHLSEGAVLTALAFALVCGGGGYVSQKNHHRYQAQRETQAWLAAREPGAAAPVESYSHQDRGLIIQVISQQIIRDKAEPDGTRTLVFGTPDMAQILSYFPIGVLRTDTFDQAVAELIFKRYEDALIKAAGPSAALQSRIAPRKTEVAGFSAYVTPFATASDVPGVTTATTWVCGKSDLGVILITTREEEKAGTWHRRSLGSVVCPDPG